MSGDHQLRLVVSYPQKEIVQHLAKLRAERETIKKTGDKQKDRRWLGAIVMLEDMQKKGGRLEVWQD